MKGEGLTKAAATICTLCVRKIWINAGVHSNTQASGANCSRSATSITLCDRPVPVGLVECHGDLCTPWKALQLTCLLVRCSLLLAHESRSLAAAFMLNNTQIH